jgi:hypothetical protein
LNEEKCFRNHLLQRRIVGSTVPLSTSQACAAVAVRSIHDSLTTDTKPITLRQVLLRLLRDPLKYLFRRWNWKSALLSSLLRASLFFATNLTAGLPAAIAAMKTELVFRAITSGFYGAITEAFREAEPPIAAALTVMVLLPIANHSIEFFVHWMRNTQNLVSSILASMILTAFSTLFNFYAMRRGALIVGHGRHSLAQDLARLPRLALDFITWPVRYLLRRASRNSASGRPDDH